jgi:tetratricopeptide (TPR) repeat protein
MNNRKHIYRFLFFLIGLFSISIYVTEAQVVFKASAPATVVEGDQFRLSYILNEDGKDLRLPDISDFDILFGPSTSTSFSQRTINGKTTSERAVTYTYILVPKKTGIFTIEPASINVKGSNYQSNSLSIEVLPPDKNSNQGGTSGSENSESSSSASTSTVSESDAFIRAIVSNNSPFEQQGFTVTFRLYTTLNVVNFGRIQFPEFEGFMVEEIEVPSNQQLKMERYYGRNYYTADLRKTLLFPQRSGQITIPYGSIEMVFSVPSGKSVSTFFGSQELMADVRKNIVTNPLNINVKPLPGDKPSNYSNAVGTFTFNPSISSTEIKANEAITLRLEISGTGNMKLLRNPELQFPNNFEVYDPVVTNSLNVTSNGLTGIRVIEYMAIPRYEGSYTIPSVDFGYFDLNTNSYKTLSTPEYELQIAKGDTGSASANNFVNQQDVKVEQDIRFLKTGEPSFVSLSNFFVGSLYYWLWYIVLSLLLIVYFIVNRKKAKENANVALMRNKKATKIAIKRLKLAEKYLRDHNKESFYDEVLRAIWGYFSDKLAIPVAQLSKDTIETELLKNGISGDLANKFMNILHTCEFARYAQVESDAEMDRIYHDTLDAIGQMENRLKKSKTNKLLMLSVLLLFIAIFTTPTLSAQDADIIEEPESTSVISIEEDEDSNLSVSAAEAYRSSDFKTSIELYEKVIHESISNNRVSAQLYYNLGNAYFRDNQLGQAILNYERALLLDPGDSDIRHNLRYANNRKVDRITPAGEIFISNWFKAIRNLYNSNVWAVIAIISFALSIISLAAYLFVNVLWVRKAAFYSFIIIFLLMIVFNIFSFSQKREQIRGDNAIVMVGAAGVNASPDDNSNELFELHEGAKVIVKSSDGNWYEIEIDNGSVGWTKKENIEKI